MGAPGYPVSAALTFDIFAAPVLAALEGTAPPERPATSARLARKLASVIGSDDWVRVRLGRVEATSSPHRCPEAPECSPPSYAPTACSSCRRESKATTPASRSTLSY